MSAMTPQFSNPPTFDEISEFLLANGFRMDVGGNLENVSCTVPGWRMFDLLNVTMKGVVWPMSPPTGTPSELVNFVNELSKQEWPKNLRVDSVLPTPLPDFSRVVDAVRPLADWSVSLRNNLRQFPDIDPRGVFSFKSPTQDVAVVFGADGSYRIRVWHRPSGSFTPITMEDLNHASAEELAKVLSQVSCDLWRQWAHDTSGLLPYLREHLHTTSNHSDETVLGEATARAPITIESVRAKLAAEGYTEAVRADGEIVFTLDEAKRDGRGWSLLHGLTLPKGSNTFGLPDHSSTPISPGRLVRSIGRLNKYKWPRGTELWVDVSTTPIEASTALQVAAAIEGVCEFAVINKGEDFGEWDMDGVFLAVSPNPVEGKDNLYFSVSLESADNYSIQLEGGVGAWRSGRDLQNLPASDAARPIFHNTAKVFDLIDEDCDETPFAKTFVELAKGQDTSNHSDETVLGESVIVEDGAAVRAFEAKLVKDGWVKDTSQPLIVAWIKSFASTEPGEDPHKGMILGAGYSKFNLVQPFKLTDIPLGEVDRVLNLINEWDRIRPYCEFRYSVSKMTLEEIEKWIPTFSDFANWASGFKVVSPTRIYNPTVGEEQALRLASADPESKVTVYWRLLAGGGFEVFAIYFPGKGDIAVSIDTEGTGEGAFNLRKLRACLLLSPAERAKLWNSHDYIGRLTGELRKFDKFCQISWEEDMTNHSDETVLGESVTESSPASFTLPFPDPSNFRKPFDEFAPGSEIWSVTPPLGLVGVRVGSKVTTRTLNTPGETSAEIIHNSETAPALSANIVSPPSLYGPEAGEAPYLQIIPKDSTDFPHKIRTGYPTKLQALQANAHALLRHIRTMMGGTIRTLRSWSELPDPSTVTASQYYPQFYEVLKLLGVLDAPSNHSDETVLGESVSRRPCDYELPLPTPRLAPPLTSPEAVKKGTVLWFVLKTDAIGISVVGVKQPRTATQDGVVEVVPVSPVPEGVTVGDLRFPQKLGMGNDPYVSLKVPSHLTNIPDNSTLEYKFYASERDAKIVVANRLFGNDLNWWKSVGVFKGIERWEDIPEHAPKALVDSAEGYGDPATDLEVYSDFVKVMRELGYVKDTSNHSDETVLGEAKKVWPTDTLPTTRNFIYDTDKVKEAMEVLVKHGWKFTKKDLDHGYLLPPNKFYGNARFYYHLSDAYTYGGRLPHKLHLYVFRASGDRSPIKYREAEMIIQWFSDCHPTVAANPPNPNMVFDSDYPRTFSGASDFSNAYRFALQLPAAKLVQVGDISVRYKVAGLPNVLISENGGYLQVLNAGTNAAGIITPAYRGDEDARLRVYETLVQCQNETQFLQVVDAGASKESYGSRSVSMEVLERACSVQGSNHSDDTVLGESKDRYAVGDRIYWVAQPIGKTLYAMYGNSVVEVLDNGCAIFDGYAPPLAADTPEEAIATERGRLQALFKDDPDSLQAALELLDRSFPSTPDDGPGGLDESSKVPASFKLDDKVQVKEDEAHILRECPGVSLGDWGVVVDVINFEEGIIGARVDFGGGKSYWINPHYLEKCPEDTSNHSDDTVLGESKVTDEELRTGDEVWMWIGTEFDESSSVRKAKVSKTFSEFGGRVWSLNTVKRDEYCPRVNAAKTLPKLRDQLLSLLNSRLETEKRIGSGSPHSYHDKYTRQMATVRRVIPDTEYNHSDETVLGESAEEYPELVQGVRVKVAANAESPYGNMGYLSPIRGTLGTVLRQDNGLTGLTVLVQSDRINPTTEKPVISWVLPSDLEVIPEGSNHSDDTVLGEASKSKFDPIDDLAQEYPVGTRIFVLARDKAREITGVSGAHVIGYSRFSTPRVEFRRDDGRISSENPCDISKSYSELISNQMEYYSELIREGSQSAAVRGNLAKLQELSGVTNHSDETVLGESLFKGRYQMDKDEEEFWNKFQLNSTVYFPVSGSEGFTGVGSGRLTDYLKSLGRAEVSRTDASGEVLRTTHEYVTKTPDEVLDAEEEFYAQRKAGLSPGKSLDIVNRVLERIRDLRPRSNHSDETVLGE